MSYGTHRCTNQVYPNLCVRQYSSDHSKKSSGSGSGALLAVGALVLTGGATLAYAKYDAVLEKHLSIIFPLLSQYLKIAHHQEI